MIRYSRFMSRNPDLVPTPIVDVNGRLTVVHKLRSMFSKAPKIPAPGPAVAGSTPGGSVSTPAVAVRQLMRMLPVPTDKIEVQELSDRLSSNFSTESLDWLSGVLSEGGPLAEGVGKQIVDARFGEGESGITEAEAFEIDVRNNVAFYPLLGIDDYAEVRGMVWSLGLAERFGGTRDFTPMSEDKKQRCAAAMIAARDVASRYPVPLHEEGYPVFMHKRRIGGIGSVLNEPLFSFVFENPDERAEIVDAVVASNSMNPEVLRGVMSGVTLPLAEGAL